MTFIAFSNILNIVCFNKDTRGKTNYITRNILTTNDLDLVRHCVGRFIEVPLSLCEWLLTHSRVGFFCACGCLCTH